MTELNSTLMRTCRRGTIDISQYRSPNGFFVVVESDLTNWKEYEHFDKNSQQACERYYSKQVKKAEQLCGISQ